MNLADPVLIAALGVISQHSDGAHRRKAGLFSTLQDQDAAFLLDVRFQIALDVEERPSGIAHNR